MKADRLWRVYRCWYAEKLEYELFWKSSTKLSCSKSRISVCCFWV